MNMTLNVPLLRSDTPRVAKVLHFNSAGVALPPRPVLDAVTSRLMREGAIGGVEAAAEIGHIAEPPSPEGCGLIRAGGGT